MMMISPSRLAIAAAGFRPIGMPAVTEGRCKMCGFEHNQGDPVVDAALPDSFTSWGELSAPGSPVVCGSCAAVSQDPWMQAWMNACITQAGVYKFASNADIAYWLLNPPDGPFVMTRGDQQKQHLVWRTPVNYNREVYQVRIGEKLVTIRRAHLIKARDAALALSDLMNAQPQASIKRGRKAASSFTNPFVAVAREMDSLAAGVLKHEVAALAANDPAAAEHVAVLRQCTPGEIWGLTAVLYSEPSLNPTLHTLKTK